MASPLARGRETVDDLRGRYPLLDHAVRTQQHFSRVNGSGLAGAVTYYAFLSFFPILALAFFVVGYVSEVFPAARDKLTSAISTVLPHILGEGEGQIRLSTIEHAAGTAGLIGGIGLLYAGLGWLSAMRRALETVFELPRSAHPGFVVGKLRDLASLVVIGVALLLTVAVTGVVTGSSTWVLDLVGLGHDLSWLVRIVGAVVGVVANVMLFSVQFRLLARPAVPQRALVQGAALGAIGFEALKLGSTLLLVATRGRPAFQVLGIALILLVWINYFSRIVMYAAAWAYTSAPARAARDRYHDVVPVVAGTAEPATTASGPRARRGHVDPRLAFGAGAAAALGLVSLLRRRREG